MIGETVVRLRPGTSSDKYGDTVAGADVEKQIRGVAVAPRYSREYADNRSAVIVGLTLYFPAGTKAADVLASDRFRVRGLVYEVEGEPGEWVNPYTNVSRGIEAAVKRTTG